MAQKNRSKEVWLVPKRINLHQMVCLIDGIVEKKYDGTSWNVSKQSSLGVSLKKWGATLSGKNISPQAIRTLAALPQYLGFLYINTETTPNSICLTPAGRQLWENHKDSLVKIPNLAKGKDKVIVESVDVLHQMEKLQITNPIILKDCENIYLFPFRFMLKILREMQYLDQEEIAYFLFRSRTEDEFMLIISEIANFRALSEDRRNVLIDTFKQTHIGNITLVQAPSSGYYISLCTNTGIIEKSTIKPANSSKKLTSIKIKKEYEEYVDFILDTQYKEADIYDFSDNLKLWIDYIGTPSRLTPPINMDIQNETGSSVFIQLYKDNDLVGDDLLEANSSSSYPVFINEEYVLHIRDISNGNIIESHKLHPTYNNRSYIISGDLEKKEELEYSFEIVAQKILSHSKAKYFSEDDMSYLNIIKKLTGIDKTKDLSLRGAFYEYYFFLLLSCLRNEGIVDDVIWNGKLGKYRLPVPAPGGRMGTPDLVFTIDDQCVVLELTTIKSKAAQFSVEGAAVPDHIRLYKDISKHNVSGVFCAPIIDVRTENIMKSALKQYGIKLTCITDESLIELLSKRDKDFIKNYFK